MSRVVIGCHVAVPRSHWSAVPTLLFDNISQLLRDSFSVSQQPAIWEPPSHSSMPYNLLKSSKWSNFGFGLQVQRAGQNQVKCESKSRKRLPRCTVVLLLTNKTNLNQDCTPDCNHTDSHKVYHRYYSYYRLMQCRSTRDQEYKRHSFSSMDIAENNVLLQNSI